MPGYTDTRVAQLTAYMGVVHASKKDQMKDNYVVYGAASDGLSFRFYRISNESLWSTNRLSEWRRGDEGTMYSIFGSLIRIAALSSPSTSLVKNPK